jgi:hypothetical protein
MAATREIQTNQLDLGCDVCGRTLLRGERAEPFLAGGARRQVCELCAPRAQAEGWIREGAGDHLALGATRHDGRRRSVWDRLRGRRRTSVAADWAPAEEEPPSEELVTAAPEPAAEPAARAAGEEEEPLEATAAEEDGAEPELEAPTRPVKRADAAPRARRRPRHVRAVPTNAELKMQRALEVFNASEHTRTVGGVARSLGAPAVAVRPLADQPSVVSIAVVWELSWYRYEIDLSDEAMGVRQVGKGDEVHELGDADRQVNAAAVEAGALQLRVEARQMDE